MKNEKKIRRMLGDKYHLCSDGDGWWVLYRYYRDTDMYFSQDNKSIMSSDTHTEEDLIKFLKTHREWDLNLIMNKAMTGIFFVIWMLSIINIFEHNQTLRIIIASSFLPVITLLFVKSVVSYHNSKVWYREIKECWEKLDKKYEDSK